ncbi:MAG: hypothetical protein JF593_10520 [Novosphingobium sp.]|nr:hypothetical protein [Novosphingobium sp.]
MSKPAAGSWISTWLEAWAVAADAGVVIALRSAKLAAGGAEGAAEFWLMVNEKAAAMALLQTTLLTGNLGRNPRVIADRAIAHVGRKVRANRKRLGG